MSVGFFVVVRPDELSRDKTDSAFVGNTPWELDGGEREVDIAGRNWRLICLKDRDSVGSTLWREKERPEFEGSFVKIMGWCYRISTCQASLSVEDYRQMLETVRAGKPPLDDDFGGNFVVLAYDAQRQRLAIQPDRLAMGSIFFANENGEFASSNRALRVASYFQTALDGHSVLAQMRGTHLPFGRSMFAGVHRVMGSGYLEFELALGTAQAKKPSSLFIPTREISYADSVDLVADSVRTIVRRLLATGLVQFDLTGGNDTRVLASAVENLTRNNGHAKFGFRIADPEGTPDVRVARRLAESCGWPLTRVDRYPLPEASSNDLARAATCSDGNFPVHYIWERVASDRVYAGRAPWKVHVGAASGELFRGFFYTHEMLSLGRSSKVNYDALLAYRTYASRGVDLSVFGAQAPTFDAHDQVLLAPYRDIGDEGGSRPNVNKLDVMYLQRHCYRSGNTLSYLFGFSDVRVPFLSWELAGLGLSLPWRYRANRGLVQRVIGKLSPKLAEIPNEDGLPMKPLSLATLPTYLRAEIPIELNRAGRVIRRFVGRSAEIKRESLPVPQAAYFAVVDNATALPAIFDPGVIRQIRSEVASGQGSRDSSLMLYVLCTLELLLKEVPHLQQRLIFN
jgi:hypothetical protein